ncbi:MAG: ASCH domain-containing protein [Candidatus Nomurabacteria bacterium]
MILNSHLHNESFEKIKNGSKKIEARLLDEKRKLIKVGDKILFLNRENSETLMREVKDIIFAISFERLLIDRNIKDFGYDTKEEFLEVLYQFYSKEDEEKLGVIGIVF